MLRVSSLVLSRKCLAIQSTCSLLECKISGSGGSFWNLINKRWQTMNFNIKSEFNQYCQGSGLYRIVFTVL
jgi:hypothetical protein